MEETQARKKIKLGEESSLAPLSPLTFTAEKRDQLRSDFSAAKPFPHIAVSDFCEDSFLRSAREEIINNLKADYKETDIFKVFQTCDLANLEGSDESTKSLIKMRDSIYSKEFRDFIQHVTGCPPLTDQVDCSCNIYPMSGHLLCHDDVIGSRCVSYIIYLTDPDTPWTEADGGSLELYQLGPDKEPECNPAKKILPAWNQIVFFNVEPDLSYHSIEEVLTENNHRLSISGWFRTAEEHNKISQSSLSQLQTAGQIMEPEFACTVNLEDDVVPEETLEYLKEWINPIYLNQEEIDKIYEKFRDDGSIQLQNFLNEEKSTQLEPLLISSGDRNPRPGWTVTGPPHKHRYLRYTGDGPGDDLGSMMRQIQENLFHSDHFCALLHHLTGLEIHSGSSQIRCFRPGSDYTVAIYNPSKGESLDAVLCFVHSPDEDSELMWESGEVGGFEAYLLADESEKSAAEVYRADEDDDGLLSVSPRNNTLNLVLSDEGLIKFVKYLSASATGCRWDISTEYGFKADPAEQPSSS